MTETLAEIGTRLQSVQQLRAVVTTMRGIAATRAREARAALAGMRTYSDVVAAALADVVPLLRGGPAPQSAQCPAVVLFCAEHGFAGAYSERVLETAFAVAPRAAWFVIGSRGVLAAEERRRPLAWWSPMASQIGAVAATAQSAAEALYSRFIAAELDRVDVVYTRSDAGSHPVVETRRLLPLDLSSFGSARRAMPPLLHLPPQRLLARLVGAYVLAELAHAASESFASENTARLETMSAARTHIDDAIAALAQRERQLRQESITAELLDMVAGSLTPASFP